MAVPIYRNITTAFLFFVVVLSASGQTAVLTQHNDNLRTGQNTSETILNTSDVNSNEFGKLFEMPSDGQVYAQPLDVPGVTINGGVHTVTAPVLVSIAVTPANPSIAKNATQQFTATGTYSDNSTQNLTSSVTRSSTSTAVATITSKGLASGVSQGNTTIRVASGSISGSTHSDGLTARPLTSVARPYGHCGVLAQSDLLDHWNL
jgi:hypothetical protein